MSVSTPFSRRPWTPVARTNLLFHLPTVRRSSLKESFCLAISNRARSIHLVPARRTINQRALALSQQTTNPLLPSRTGMYPCRPSVKRKLGLPAMPSTLKN